MSRNPTQTADGTLYASQRAAAIALGKAERTVAYHLDRYGDLSTVGKCRGKPGSGKRNPFRVGHRAWPSQAALARYIGVYPSTLCKWLKRGDMESLMGAVMKADAKAANVKVAA